MDNLYPWQSLKVMGICSFRQLTGIWGGVWKTNHPPKTECHFLHQPANLVGRKFQISQEILFVIEKNFNCYPFPQRKIAHHTLTAYNLRPCKLIIDYSKLFDSFEASVIVLDNVALHRNQNTDRRSSGSCPFVNRFLS